MRHEPNDFISKRWRLTSFKPIDPDQTANGATRDEPPTLSLAHKGEGNAEDPAEPKPPFRTSGTSLFALAFLAVLAWLGSPAFAADAPVLERVVMLSRHGVRSPTRRVEVLESLTKHAWPAWPVAPGEMTAHGEKDLALMADFLRATYQERKLLPKTGCPERGAVEVWSDVADHRTRRSGDIWAERLAPGCKLAARHAAAGTVDPLFDASKTKTCPVGLFATGGQLLSAARETARGLEPKDRHALDVLQSLLAPEACKSEGTSGPGICLVPDPHASIEKAIAAIGFARPFAEAIYLEYVQGMPETDIGWGKPVDAATVTAIMPVHERGMDVLRRAPTLAARRGAVMARTILALLQGGEGVKGGHRAEGAPPLDADARLVMIVGHDSNLFYMAALMGLDWTLHDQPAFTPPDGTLAFEVWHVPGSERRTLRLRLYAQTLAQLRNETVLDAVHPAETVDVVPEACAAAGRDGCDPKAFAESVERHLAAICAR